MDDNDNNVLQKLSQNLLEILDDGEEYYDIAIEVGNDPNVRIFRAHMVILNYRSSYLRRILATNKKKIDENFMIQIKLPNILPEIFQIILRYIYGGKLSLEDYDNLDIIKLLITASELNLQELVIYIQSFLIKNKTNWMEQNFNLIYQTSIENDSFLELQKYCTDLIYKTPHKIFKSLDFTSIPEKILVSLIQNDNLQMGEIKIWKNVLKWGLAQNPEITSDPSNFSKDDFNFLKNTLKQCIPFIRFYYLTSKEFSDNILPYKEVLPEELYMDLLSLHPDSESNYESKPRMSDETYRSVSSTPPPPMLYYPGYPVTNYNSQEQNLNETKEVIGPLITQIQPSPKNSNYNEHFTKSNERNHRRGGRKNVNGVPKSSKRDHRKGGGFEKFTSQIEELDEEKVSSWDSEEPIKNTWKKPVMHNIWKEHVDDTWGTYDGYIPRWSTEANAQGGTNNGNNNTKKLKKLRKREMVM